MGWDDNLQENKAEGVDVGRRDIPELLRLRARPHPLAHQLVSAEHHSCVKRRNIIDFRRMLYDFRRELMFLVIYPSSCLFIPFFFFISHPFASLSLRILACLVIYHSG